MFGARGAWLGFLACGVIGSAGFRHAFGAENVSQTAADDRLLREAVRCAEEAIVIRSLVNMLFAAT